MIAIILLMMTACGSNSPQMVIITQDSTTTYNGTDQQICHVADGEQCELHISVFRQDGSISISVLQMEEQAYAYRGTDIPTSDFIVFLSEPGKYCIEINAENFQGSYDISNYSKTKKENHHEKTRYQNELARSGYSHDIQPDCLRG